MNIITRWSIYLLLFATSGLAVRAQSVPAATQSSETELSPAMRQRVEALLRSKIDFPPATSLSLRVEGPGEIPGFNKLSAHFSSPLTGTTGDMSLLISKDGTRLAQYTSYDIAANPRDKVPFEGRPFRGGPATAPVMIVGFDDLECPYCAQLHAGLFPALTDHYKDQVRVVYQSLPSDGHPWAMHAAADTDCLSKESLPAYWAAVDTIHAHAQDYGGSERKLAVAEQELDAEVAAQGRRFHLDEKKLKACIATQDTASEQKGITLASSLGVITTPTLFVNGVRVGGAVPLDFIFDIVDNALKAEGKEPPLREKKPDPAPSAVDKK